MANIDRSIQKPEDVPVDKLLRYLQVLGHVGSIQYILDESKQGSYGIKSKNIQIQGPNKQEMSKTGAHEATHAISKSDMPSRTQQLIDAVNQRGLIERLFTPDLVAPKGWNTVNPKADASGVASQEMGNLGREEVQRRQQIFNDVRGSIPEGKTWSGMAKLKDNIKMVDPLKDLGGSSFEEAMAYYFTHPEVKGDYTQRTKEFAMYLRDRGVPWENIDGLLSSMRDFDGTTAKNEAKPEGIVRQTNKSSTTMKGE